MIEVWMVQQKDTEVFFRGRGYDNWVSANRASHYMSEGTARRAVKSYLRTKTSSYLPLVSQENLEVVKCTLAVIDRVAV